MSMSANDNVEYLKSKPLTKAWLKARVKVREDLLKYNAKTWHPSLVAHLREKDISTDLIPPKFIYDYLDNRMRAEGNKMDKEQELRVAQEELEKKMNKQAKQV